MTIHQTSDTSIPNASPANQSACLAFCQLAILSIFLLCTFAFCNTATAQQDFDSDLREAFDDLPAITDPGKAIQLTIKAKADDVLKYRMESSSKIDMMGLIIPRSDNYLVEYKINSNDKYGFEFTSQITEMVAKMETRNGNFSVDSVNPENERTDPPFIPLLKLWKELQASELTCKCSKQGEILDFQVPERIVEAVADNPFGFSANDLMSFFVIGLVQVPEDAVSVGDEWDLQHVAVPFGAEDFKQTGKLLGVVDVDGVQMAAIEIVYEVEMENEEGQITEVEMLTKTALLFDIEAGNVWKMSQVVESEMVMQIGENEVAQVSTGTTVITRVDD